MMRSKAYFFIVIGLANLIFLGYLGYFGLPGFFKFVTTCSAKGYVSDHYLAACATEEYGDYEHAAFYFELEEEAVRNLKSAEILFMGNSRMQFALSNSETSRFFEEELKVPFYLFGFGYAEPYRFSLELYEKFNLRPKVVVVAVDGRLFETHVSEPVRQMQKDPAGQRLHYIGKQVQQNLHKWLCGPHGLNGQRGLNGLLFDCGDSKALFRSRASGMWITEYFVDPQIEPFTITDETQMNEVRKMGSTARQFVRTLGIPKECIIFTSVPFPYWNPANTEALAREVEVVSIEQDLGRQWSTLDKSHLIPEDGKRLSRHLLRKMRPVFERCLKR